VTGFHKRKKKRRKEAQKVLQEKERKKRIEERKRVSNSHNKNIFSFSARLWFWYPFLKDNIGSCLLKGNAPREP
jgi:hypothetical protein